MLVVPVFDMKGKSTGTLEIDPAALGDRVRHRLIKQAVVAYLDHARQDSARTKRRSDVEGSTRKLYRQKGTGNARAGMLRTPIRRGGGRAFAKRGPRGTKVLPKKMRRLARNSAILAKIQSQDAMIIDDLACEQIKTKTMVSMFSALGLDGGCVLTLHERDEHVWLSSRNSPRTEVRVLEDLNAYDVLRRRKLVLTRPAFERLLQNPASPGGGEIEN